MSENPLLVESPLPYGAPQFDKIRAEHYMPAFKQGIAEAKAEIDAIVDNQEDPDFANTIEALEFAGSTLNRVAGIFYNILEADTNDELQQIAEEVSPLMTEYEMYVSLNDKLFDKVKAVYGKKDSLGLEPDQMRLLENTYRSFARNGANLSPEDKAVYSKYVEELSLLSLQFGKNVLASANAYQLHLSDSSDLAGLPDYVKEIGAMTAKERGLDGWVFTLDYPSYLPFMQNSTRPDLRKQMFMAYNSKAVGGDNDNTGNVKKIADLRIKIANILGYDTWADYILEENMAKDKATVVSFLDNLMQPSLPYARKEVAEVFEYAKANGFAAMAEAAGMDPDQFMPWDFSYWSEKYKQAEYALSDEQLKPYFRLEDCIDAVFSLAERLYGISFEERTDIPVYHKDVKVYDVKDVDGSHLALFYADFFPRASKRGGAWMTEFRGQSIRNGIEARPLVSIVTNFSKPTENAPSLLTHDELCTFLHEFGHSLHGMFAEGRYTSLCGTNVSRDFVELPSQIMENWAFEPEYLNSFAKDYRSGEVIPAELVEKIVRAKNYLAGYYQVRQLDFGTLDMAWHTLTALPEAGTIDFEKAALAPSAVMPKVEGTAISPAFNHIFSGGYSAGYYSYKWAEVLEADAFSLFKEKGIFNREVASSFRENVLSKGDTEDPAVLYRRFRGHDPEPSALMEKLGLTE
ncbi:MAG: M3 family metallopeptidase [Candidatus Cryptobacteroides sp.]